jgi:hypothetical protein
MKRLFILSLLLFSFSTTLAQSFSLSELIKMEKMDLEIFDTYVTSKGYVFFNKGKYKNSVHYALNVNGDKASKFIAKDVNLITFQTSVKSEYLKIKNQLKSNGFKFNKSEVENNSVEFIYKKGVTAIVIYAKTESFEINYVTKTGKNFFN